MEVNNKKQSKSREFVEQHRHTEKGKDPENTWGDVDCIDTLDFGTGKSTRELKCSVCGASISGLVSTAVVVSPYGSGEDNKDVGA